jgi:hypothetical protein
MALDAILASIQKMVQKLLSTPHQSQMAAPTWSEERPVIGGKSQ